MILRYIPVYFRPEELVPKVVFELLGAESLNLFDPRILITADQLRSHFGRCNCNTWLWGGRFHERGFRLRHSQTGAPESMHKDARGLDLVFMELTAAAVRQEIMRKRHLFPFITRMEKGRSWLHYDNKETGSSKIILFKP
ncbi:MAG: hypothetical protein KAU20_02260 [Nanoarchaeota archaeon]|nr:hypothetical protein [Nanoarchaeota archaeon]